MNKEIKADYRLIISIAIITIVAACFIQFSGGYGTSDYWVWELLMSGYAQILAIRRVVSKKEITCKNTYIDIILLAICFFGFLSFHGYLIRKGDYSLSKTLVARFLIILLLYNMIRMAHILRHKMLYLIGIIMAQWIYIYFVTVKWSKYLNEDLVYGGYGGSLLEKIYSYCVSYSCVPRGQVFVIGSLVVIVLNILVGKVTHENNKCSSLHRTRNL